MAKKSKSQNPVVLLVVITTIVVAIVAIAVSLNRADDNETASSDGVISEVITPQTYNADWSNADHVLIDVRTPEEYESGYIEGAININVQTLSSNLDQIPEGLPIVVYCRSGNRSAQAADILENAGYTEIYDLGGVIQWTQAGYDLVITQ